MDQLIIKDLELFAYHGVYQEEKTMGQKFIVEAYISLDLSKAGESDRLEYALNYAKLCHELQEEFLRTKHDLIERAATVLCEYILFHYPQVEEVDLILKKPWAPIHLPIDYPAIRMKRSWHYAYIAFGSNLGDRQAILEDAFSIINRSDHSKILKTSSIIETEPVGYTEQGSFLNGVFYLKTLLSPLALIRYLMSVEKELKRERIIKWGPRTLDLDILYYDDIISSIEEIVIPHPRMHERLFVLEPLNEIAPFAMHPVFHRRSYELLDTLKKSSE